MKRFAIFHGYIVDARPDGDIGLNAKIQAVIDKDDRGALFAQSLVAQANLANDLLTALRDLVKRCDGPEGVRADGSNIQTMWAHTAIAKAEGCDE